jgi:hypothetical protein
MSNTRKRLGLWQIQPIPFSAIENFPETWNELGLTGEFPFVNYTIAQTLTEGQKQQARENIGVTLGTPITLGTPNGLTLNGQELSLNLATTENNGAMSASDKIRVNGANITQGSGLTITGTLNNRVLGTGAVTFAVDATVLRTTGEQVITGLKRTRRAGTSDGVTPSIVKRWEIGSDNLYKLDLINWQNEQQSSGQVQWNFRLTFNAFDGIARESDMIGFAKYGITVLGGRNIPSAILTNAGSLNASNIADPNYRYPVRQYAYGTTQSEGLIVGEGLLTSKIDSETKAYIGGGLRTSAPFGGNEATVQFGEYEASVNTTIDTVWIVRVGDKLLEVKARDVTPV